jgi:rare lipoprotein A
LTDQSVSIDVVGLMKRYLYTSLSLLFLIPACSRHVVHISGPSKPSKVAVLYEKEKGEIPGSYEVNGQRYYPLPSAYGFTQTGKASWYGNKFHGRATSSGELFDMNKKSAAHKTLPFGTYVKVVNLSNQKNTVVRINDRGPFIKGRVIDLSYAAAREIDLIRPGVDEVKIIALGREVGKTNSEKGSEPLVEITDLEHGEFTIQVGAYQDKRNAEKIAERLRVIFDYVRVTVYVDDNRQTLHRVQASKSKTLTQAEKNEKRLEDLGFKSAFIVRI